MYTYRNNSFLLSVKKTDYIGVLFKNPEWNGSYDYYNRKIYKTVLNIVNQDDKTIAEAGHYTDCIKNLLNKYSIYIKIVKNDNIKKRIIYLTIDVLRSQVRYETLDNILNLYEQLFTPMVDNNVDSVRILYNRITNMIGTFRNDYNLKQLINTLKLAYPKEKILEYIA